MTIAHLDGYQTCGAINVTGEKKFREFINPLLAKSKGRGFQ